MAGRIETGLWTDAGAAKTGFDLEGAEIGTATTLILTDMKTGRGPRLHKHPYPEIWVIAAGRALFTAGTQTFEAGPGDIVHVDADMPHKFVVTSEGPARMVCIHEAARFTTTWLE